MSELIKCCSYIDMLTALPDATNNLTLPCHEQRAGAATVYFEPQVYWTIEVRSFEAKIHKITLHYVSLVFFLWLRFYIVSSCSLKTDVFFLLLNEYIASIVLYLYTYIVLLAVHTNQKRFQCEIPKEKRAVLRERKEALCSPVKKRSMSEEGVGSKAQGQWLQRSEP